MAGVLLLALKYTLCDPGINLLSYTAFVRKTTWYSFGDTLYYYNEINFGFETELL